VPFAAGAGAVDAAARLMGERMGSHLNATVVVVPQPGAGSHLGANNAAKSPKDGYTLFFGTAANLGYGKMLNKELPYDPVKDLQPLIMLGSVPVGVFVNINSDIRTLPDLLAAARARPGALNYSTPGIGTVTHVAMEILLNRTGTKMTHVPYGNQPTYWQDLIGGTTIQMVVGGITGGLGLVKDGKLRLLTTLTGQRASATPDTPAAGEVVSGYDAPAWLALALPAGVPEDVVARLEAAALASAGEAATKTAFDRLGIDLTPMARRPFAAKITGELPVWENTLRAAGMLSR